jgi:hypothetical protein
MCTGGRLIADFVAGTDTRPGLPTELEQHLTTTAKGLWVVWAHKLARPGWRCVRSYDGRRRLPGRRYGHMPAPAGARRP